MWDELCSGPQRLVEVLYRATFWITIASPGLNGGRREMEKLIFFSIFLQEVGKSPKKLTPEIRAALLGKKGCNNTRPCLVLALVHGLESLDCDFILHGTGMLMVVVKLFNDTLPEKKRDLVTSMVNFMLQQKKMQELGGPSACVILCRLVILEAVVRDERVQSLVSADILRCLEDETKRVDRLLRS